MRYLPAEYIEYIRRGGPRDGFTDLDFAGYFAVVDLELVDTLNEDLKTNEYVLGFTAFASNGGGEFYAFDANGAVYSIPYIGMSVQDAIKIAESWSDYASHIVD
jgi:hypothetical protein